MELTIEQRVKAVISKTLDVQETAIAPAATLKGDLAATSLDSYDLVLALENEFVIVIEERDIPRLQTVQQLIEYVEGAKVGFGYGHGV